MGRRRCWNFVAWALRGLCACTLALGQGPVGGRSVTPCLIGWDRAAFLRGGRYLRASGQGTAPPEQRRGDRTGGGDQREYTPRGYETESCGPQPAIG